MFRNTGLAEATSQKIAKELAKNRTNNNTPAPQKPESKPSAANKAFRRISQTVIANTVMLGADFACSSMPYGMALKAEALVKSPKFSDLFKLSEWRGAYARSWSVLKWGFYPTFLAEVAATESVKQLGSPALTYYSELFMPGIIGSLTAPAVSFAAINTRFKEAKLDLVQVAREQGVAGVKINSAGFVAIGIREAACYYALHNDTSKTAQAIADKMQSPLFRDKDGKPTRASKWLAALPDAALLAASQPLTMFAVNAATLKYQRMQQPGQPKKPKLRSPIALLTFQMQFMQDVCRQITQEGRQSGLSTFFSFSPGFVVRTSSLFITLSVFKYGLDPVMQLVGNNITHRPGKGGSTSG